MPGQDRLNIMLSSKGWVAAAQLDVNRALTCTDKCERAQFIRAANRKLAIAGQKGLEEQES